MARWDKLEAKLGYTFRVEALLVQALTHKSFSSKNNERFEFLGDSILNHAIADDLFNRFPDANEGQLSRLRASMVKQKTLADIAREFGIGDYLNLGTGELKGGGFRRDSILSDAVEAIIGAINLDADQTTAHGLVQQWYESRLVTLSPDRLQKDAKSLLQEHLQSKGLALPLYTVVRTEGEAHEQTFFVECQVEVLSKKIAASGNSRKIAEQKVAASVLSALGLNDLGVNDVR